VSDRTAVALRAALWLLLGGWIGALLLFAVVVAPAAFRILPSSELAGRLVGEILPALQIYGAFAGPTLAVLAGLLGRNRLTRLLPLGLGALGLFSLFGLTPRMEQVRDLAFGDRSDPVARATFGRLHAASGAAYAATIAGAALLVVLHARADVQPAKKSRKLP
jgi:hypothetical protein